MPDDLPVGDLPDFGATMSEILKEGIPELPESGTPPPPPAPEAKPAAGAPPSPSPAPAPRGYPKTWKPEHASAWDTLPETHAVLKDEALRREDDFHKGIEGYKTKAAMGERLERLLAPYAAQIAQYGINPDQIISGLLDAQMKLTLGQPSERVSLMRQVLKDFKISAKDLLDPGEVPGGEAPYVDPTLKALQDKLETVDSKLEADNRRRAEEIRAKVHAEVTDFAANPAHDLFDKVSGDIALLMRADPKMTLADAYDKATWANPETRKTLNERAQKADAEAREKAERERAEKAAAASKGAQRQSPRQSNATAPAGTMEETMAETLREIRARG